MNNNNENAGFMAVFKRKILASAITFAYLNVAMVPVYASDTEIYTNKDDSAPISPTLMMMFDTSGSMNYCVDSTAGSTCATTSKKRIEVLKAAMHKILLGDTTTSPNTAPAPGYIKMGLAKYHPTSDRGGYVYYPARPLDAFVALNPNGYVTAKGLTGSSDAVQGLTSILGGNELAIGSNGTIDNAAGFQFDQVTVPKGAVVSRAYIQLTASRTQSGPAKWRVEAESSDSASEYTALSLLNSRSYITDTNNDFEPEAWTAGETYRIYVTDAINNVVNRSGWCGDNDLALRVKNIPVSGVVPTQRTAYSYEGAPTADQRPQLVVEYLMDTESTTSCALIPRTTVVQINTAVDDIDWDTIPTSTTSKAVYNTNTGGLLFNKYTAARGAKNVAVRFRSVPIPFNATIDSAYLIAKAAAATTGLVAGRTSVAAFNSTDLPIFCPTTSTCAKEQDLNNILLWPMLTMTSAEATWPPTGSSTSYAVDDVYPSIPVTNAVKTITSTSGWASGNTIGFRLKNNSTTTNDVANFYSRDGSSTKSLQLTINWRERVTDMRTVTTVRDQIDAAVTALTVPSSTPLGASYAEAARYLYGMAPLSSVSPRVSLGAATTTPTVSVGDYDPSVVDDPAVGSTTVKFISPIPAEDECSANYIFLLTDGEPNDSTTNARDSANGIIGSGNCSTSSSTFTQNWDCMKKLAEYNASRTNRLGKPIRTNTVILGPETTAIANMKAVAAAGLGKAYTATDTAALVAAISNTIDDAANRSGTIAAPGVAVNQINRLNHLDQLYYAVFKPDSSYRWDGNLKRYRLSSDGGTIFDNTSPTPLNAVDPNTGLFKDGTKSFWSTIADGSQATLGGAASVLPDPTVRKMYTFLGALSATNTALTPITLGAGTFNADAKVKMGLTTSTADDTKFKNLINWYKGYEIPSLDTLVDVSAAGVGRTNRLAAALHSQPVLINYGYTDTGNPADAANPENQKNYLFFSTLGGTLHAIDAKTGTELFSFIPGEKLNTLEAQYNNLTQIVPEFGMDATWTYLRKDANYNNQIGSGDKVYLYGGMRMGGSNYYALNVTDVTNPQLLFAIQGGSTGFANMGQTWSQPTLATIKFNGASRTVLVFGGGYDPRHEVSGQLFTGNDLGNQIYIVDAFTGSLIWSASGNSADSPSTYVADMKFSIPSQVKVFDADDDGFADNIYFGDLGGQVFRIDLTKTGTSASNLVKRVKLLAKVGQTGTATIEEQHRFYEPPEIALFKDASQKYFAAIAIGSGYRSRPLNLQTEDDYFVLFDYDVKRSDLLKLTPAQEIRTEALGGLQSVITKASLSALDLNSASGATVNTKGWYIDFPESGEKVLAAGMILKGYLTFTTYVPTMGTSNCSPVVGKSKLYSMCMPYGDTCGATASVTDRVVNPNVMSGISGKSQLTIIKDETTGTYKKVLLTGTNVNNTLLNRGTADVPVLKPLQHWHEKTRNPAN